MGSSPNTLGLPDTCLVTAEDNRCLLVHGQGRSGELDPHMELGLPNSSQQTLAGPDRLGTAETVGEDDTYLPAEELTSPPSRTERLKA